MRLEEVFDERLIKLDLRGETREECFSELVSGISAVHPELESGAMLRAINERENKLSTLIMPGVALPHGCYRNFDKVVGAIGVSRKGIDYRLGQVNVIFMLLLGEAVREKHLHVLSGLFTFINSGALPHIKNAKSPQEVYGMLSRYRA